MLCRILILNCDLWGIGMVALWLPCKPKIEVRETILKFHVHLTFISMRASKWGLRLLNDLIILYS